MIENIVFAAIFGFLFGAILNAPPIHNHGIVGSPIKLVQGEKVDLNQDGTWTVHRKDGCVQKYVD